MVNAFGGEWTRDKLQILEDYLRSYTTVMKNQSFHNWYIDAFAGTGFINVDSRDEVQGKLLISDDGWDGEMANLSKGSARRAVEVDDKPFDELTFIEQNFEYAIKAETGTERPKYSHSSGGLKRVLAKLVCI